MSIHTSYFANMKKIQKEHPEEVFISVAGYSPKWFKVGFLPELAPKKWWWKIWYDSFKDNLESDESKAWYIEKYKSTVLELLDTEKILLKLGSEYQIADITLLCYETPEKFCHRHLIADWLNNWLYTSKKDTKFCRPVVEWMDSSHLDIRVAKVILKSMNLKLEPITQPEEDIIWSIIPFESTRTIGLFTGNARYIFEEIMCERELYAIKNPYFGMSYEELVVRATIADPQWNDDQSK